MVSPTKRPVLIALGGALVFNLLLLSLQANHYAGPGAARTWMMDILAPIEKVADIGVDGVWGVWEGYVALLNVRAENQKLQADNATLQMENRRLVEADREAERLRELTNLAKPALGKSVFARVIGRDPSRSEQTITIGKGDSEGIKVNAPVISPEGVVGRVIAVGRLSALVQLLSDPQSAVGVLVQRSRVQAVFRGNGSREIELDYIDNDNEVEVGDELITSGLDGLYPKGLPVGAITVVDPRRGLFRVVRSRLHVDLGRLEEVLVLLEPVVQPEAPKPNLSSTLPSD
jgi:rod shape-determining protein MreC